MYQVHYFVPLRVLCYKSLLWSVLQSGSLKGLLIWFHLPSGYILRNGTQEALYIMYTVWSVERSSEILFCCTIVLDDGVNIFVWHYTVELSEHYVLGNATHLNPSDCWKILGILCNYIMVLNIGKFSFFLFFWWEYKYYHVMIQYTENTLKSNMCLIKYNCL